MKTDHSIQKDVLDELAFDPSIHAADIGVSVNGGVVSLSGHVPNFGEKYSAEKAAFRVVGVKAVVDELDVYLPGSQSVNDIALAQSAAATLESHVNVPPTVKVSVEEGKLILHGTVLWAFQRDAAVEALRYLKGVRYLANHIIVLPQLKTDDVKLRIEDALLRVAAEHARGIRVEVLDGKVVLSGTVHSKSEYDNAKWAAWAAPGVAIVDNNLIIT